MIVWFVRNPVAANLLMGSILLAGVYAALAKIPVEVYPDFEHGVVRIDVPFPGASPADAEAGVLLRIEEAVAGLQGIGEIRGSAREGRAEVALVVGEGYDPRELLDEVRTRVDAIPTFPAEAERPTYRIDKSWHEAISLVVAGPFSERSLLRLGERVRDDLHAIPGITRVTLAGARPYEISVEVPEATLQHYGLTLAEVAAAIRAGSLDLSAGRIRTRAGEVLLRTRAQAYEGGDFASIVVRAYPGGAQLMLGDVAQIRDGFGEHRVEMRHDGAPALFIEVFRTGNQSAIEIAAKVRSYVEDARRRFPPGASIAVWSDQSRIILSRLTTLLESAWQGAALIFILLTLFLRFRVALWVCLGIPVSFAGALMLMPVFGVTINTISVFAFILVLGLVVDDAVVTGENICRHLERGGDPETAAVQGTREIAMLVTFGILTTVVAFVPLLFIEGAREQLSSVSIVAIAVLVFSLVESKLILPAHMRRIPAAGGGSGVARLQRRFADGIERAAAGLYQPLLAHALRHRYLVLALFAGGAIVVASALAGGRIPFVFFPRIHSEIARATLLMPPGTPFEVTREHVERISAEAERLRERYAGSAAGGDGVIGGILATVGSSRGPGHGASNEGQVWFLVAPPEELLAELTSPRLVREWRAAVGVVPGAESLDFQAEAGRSDPPIHIELAGRDTGRLARMAETVKDALRSYPGVFEVGDSFERGKEELRIKLRPAAEELGISPRDLARQVRQAFFGEEAQRIQRGPDDVRVMVRYPRAERGSIETLARMRIRTPAGAEVPFAEVAEVETGRGEAEIRRVDRYRVVDVTAEVDRERVSTTAIKREIAARLRSESGRWPDVRWSFKGDARAQRESLTGLAFGLAFVIFAVYAMLAIPFRSYLQPFIVLSVLPFGAVGAILGHVILGVDLSLFSLAGMLALAGVVVNDSLVLVEYVNRRREAGAAPAGAAQGAGVARMRAVLLTSLTTFAGLAPLMLDASTQGQYLVPMAISLGFGVLFATVITLLLVPINYLILEDLKGLFARPHQAKGPDDAPAA